MSEISQAEKYLLEGIRRGEAEPWSQLVGRYQGRLVAFAQARLPQRADAEDVVQETFFAFLKSLGDFRAQASLETYLFAILRRNIINSYRSKTAKKICLLQDIYQSTDDSTTCDPYQQIAAPDPTASWYVRRDEQHDLQRTALAGALRELVNGFKDALDFRNLQIMEMIFYCHLSNKDVGRCMDMNEKSIAVIKHRCLKQVREQVAKFKFSAEAHSADFEMLLTEIWENYRLSCLKRSTIGAYLLETLDRKWRGYVDFHLNKLGCHFCRANLEDLRRQNSQSESGKFRKRIMESTVGFLLKQE